MAQKKAQMPAKTLAALKKSIEHWERLASGENDYQESIYSGDCALCGLFYHYGEPTDCDGCPVKAKTGRRNCKNSPWQRVSDAKFDHGEQSDAFRAAAGKELAFLKSLLPKKPRTKKKAARA